MRVRGLSFKFIDKQMDEFNAQVQSAMKAVVQDGIIRGESAADVSLDDLNSIPSRWTRELDNGILAAALGYFLAAANEQAENVGTALTSAAEVAPEFAEYTIASEDESARAYLAGARNRLVGIGNELWSNARQELVAGMESGEGIPQLTKRVQASAGVTAKRARVIARTEVVGASNAGSIAVMRQLGEVAKKEWINTHDGRTRPTHITAGGQTVDLNDRFQVGASSLDHPGDPAGAAKEVINCRCTMGYELNDDDPLNPPVTMPIPTAATQSNQLQTETPRAPGIELLPVRLSDLRPGDRITGPAGSVVEVVQAEAVKRQVVVHYKILDGKDAGKVKKAKSEPEYRTAELHRDTEQRSIPRGMARGTIEAGWTPSLKDYARFAPKALITDQGERARASIAMREEWDAISPEMAKIRHIAEQFSFGAQNIANVRSAIQALRAGVPLEDVKWPGGGTKFKSGTFASVEQLEEETRLLVAAINNAPTDMVPASLWRGMAIEGDFATLAARYTPGTQLTWDINSFTSDVAVGEYFINNYLTNLPTGKKPPTAMMIELVGDKRALPIQNIVHGDFQWQQEWLSGGQYEVVKIMQREDGGIHMQVRQIGKI